MNEAQSILQMPRSRELVVRALHSADEHYWVLIRLKADFLALDMRPMLVNLETGDVTRVGTYEPPQELTNALNDAAERVGRLRCELASIARIR